MTSYTWKKSFLRNNELPLKVVEVIMKEIVHSDYNIQTIKKPCWLVFKHTDTNDFCCIGKVDIEHQKLSDVMNLMQTSANYYIPTAHSFWPSVGSNYSSVDQHITVESLPESYRTFIR